MNAARRPGGDQNPSEPFVPDFSEGAETGLYLALLELLDEGLIITGDEVILEVNSAACRLLGRDYRQLAGQPLADIFPSERAFLAARARLFIQGEMRGSLQVATPAGTRELKFIAAARIRPGIHALILSPDLAAAAVADPTNEGSGKDTLWPRLAAALEQPVLVIDERCGVAAANAAALRSLGIERSALVGRQLEDCVAVNWPAAGAPPLATLQPPTGPALSARVLPGPKPGWHLLILPPVAAIAPQPATSSVRTGHPPTQSAVQPTTGDTVRPEAISLDTGLGMALDVLDAARQPILVSDARYRILAINKTFAESTGYSADGLLGKDMWRLLAEQPDPHLGQSLRRALALTGRWTGELPIRLNNGDTHFALVSITAVGNPHGAVQYYVGVLAAQSTRSRTALRADYVATHDMLTGLANRTLFERRFGEAAERARHTHRSVGLLRIDVDHFKAVNREFGDHIGDDILRQIACRLQGAVPDGATVARERSDTFLALLPDLTLDSDCGRYAEAILAALCRPFEAGNRQLKLSASIGIAVFPEHGGELAELARHADAALAHVRQLGGNNYQYYADTMHGVRIEHSALGPQLRHAAERQQLEIHFQPLVDGRHGSVRGGEALLRWRHPDLGLIPFQRFSRSARDYGLIAELGTWVLTTACRQAARWPAVAGQPPLLTINIAIEQIMQGELVEQVVNALQVSGLAADRLELDLDEVILQEEHRRIVDTLDKLAALGVRLAVDDFGRGLCAIPRLKRYPLRALKLYPALVRDVGVREEAEAVVEAMASMAGVLGLEVFARGVEGQAQQAFLCALGCSLQQGPLFGRPLSADEFLSFLAARTTAR
ncbi:putative bifunctional diguanylate cyclase/phosphodiesterase [Pseudothauera hydrothermalis]|uniref:putative bifunctional diguanylate cyclase/phosphodiesterase n=1 Tax=Pseudothauera hydrothermalis TaxID=2184083 RepID=UPI001F27B98D|nr:GGDEF and EAL domain-containing protein [Pseudothauera hydrothermalis]